MQKFDEEYKKLNQAQKEAVDTVEGPVMVVAGPGTGKTQVLALRIGNILVSTDTKADGILCLTFTNSAVRAMRERLRKYIGVEAGKVKIATFHGFGMEMIEKYYRVLGMEREPKLLDEKDSILLCDRILHGHPWEYLRPRADTARYFSDLKNLISLLKRERITPENFAKEIEKEISELENSPDSISSRGARKGELKKEVETKIEGLARSREAVQFYEFYEKEKIESGVLDYDDVLENLVKIMEESETARVEIKEEFLYVRIDEHQDSSGVQNEFLSLVWSGVEKPNIFVVGDDRQLIYGFGGASLEYFENFKNTFGKAKLITLVENYRSTGKILDASHSLLQSSLTAEKLKSNREGSHPLRLVEASYPRDEIIACGLEIKELLKKNKTEGGEQSKTIDPNEIAILVPKNRQVRSVITILKDMGLPVSSGEAQDFFDSPEALSLLRVLKILAHPEDGVALGESLFDGVSDIPPLSAHKFLREQNMRDFSLLDVVAEKNDLFSESSATNKWIEKLHSWLTARNSMSLYSFIQKVGSDLLLHDAKSHEDLVVRIEVVRTILHLALAQIEKDSKLNLKDFISFIERLEEYGESIPLAVFGKDEGIKVLTLHGSKGLEFDYVWIAHMDERSFSGGRRGGFTLPESIKEKVEKKDVEVLKRQLYVAITRAKRFCTISYALSSYTGANQELSQIVADLDDHFEKQSASETEKKILALDPKSYAGSSHKGKKEKESTTLKELVEIVKKDYEDRKVSVSLLNNFFECPWKWYFRNFLQLPEPKSRSLELGDIVHKAIDKILQKRGGLKEGEILELVLGDKEAEKIVAKWVKNSFPNLARDYKNEQSVSVKDDRFPHLSIYGRLDLVENISAKTVRVTDFKTGSPKKKNDIEKIDDEGRLSNLMRQLAMYAYLLKTIHKWRGKLGGGNLEFFEAKDEKGRIYRAPMTEEEIDLLVRDIEDYSRFLNSGEWVTRECHFNSYGKANAICEYCKMAEIYK